MSGKPWPNPEKRQSIRVHSNLTPEQFSYLELYLGPDDSVSAVIRDAMEELRMIRETLSPDVHLESGRAAEIIQTRINKSE